MNVIKPAGRPQPPRLKVHYNSRGRIDSLELNGQRVRGLRHIEITDGHTEATVVKLTLLVSSVEVTTDVKVPPEDAA